MININIICVGKLKEQFLRDGCAEYLKRLSPYAKTQITEVAEERASENPSAAEIKNILEKEGKRIEYLKNSFNKLKMFTSQSKLDLELAKLIGNILTDIGIIERLNLIYHLNYIKQNSISSLKDYQNVKKDDLIFADIISTIVNILEKEGARIEEKIPKGAAVIPLCIEGKEFSSPEFAAEIEKISLVSSKIVFVIGGSFGLSDKVKALGKIKLSFGKITLPHQLARLVLTEQIYRAFSIINNSRYHK